MKRRDIKKNAQLGMNSGTAAHQLRKMILFNFVKKFNLDVCFHCNKKIEKISDLSIEHKIAWLDSENPKKLFFDLDNIAYSHFSCNSSKARSAKKGTGIHPSINAYKEGCRCLECTKLHSEYYRNLRRKNKLAGDA